MRIAGALQLDPHIVRWARKQGTVKAKAGCVETNDGLPLRNVGEIEVSVGVGDRFQPLRAVAGLNDGRLFDPLPLPVDESSRNAAEPSQRDSRQFNRARLQWMGPARRLRCEALGV